MQSLWTNQFKVSTGKMEGSIMGHKDETGKIPGPQSWVSKGYMSTEMDPER